MPVRSHGSRGESHLKAAIVVQDERVDLSWQMESLKDKLVDEASLSTIIDI